MKAHLLHTLCKNCVYNRTHSFAFHRKLIPLFAMPKNRTYLPDLQKNRIKLREKKAKYNSGTAYLQILGSGGRGAAKSLYFFSDFCRYMFNCGEGTQRLAHEHKIKIARLEHIFITHPCWENIGGLPGLALTVQEVGVPDLTFHGPDGIENLFAATNRFVVLNNLNIKMAQCASNSVYDDPAVTIYYVPLLSSEIQTEKNDEYSSLLSKASESRDDIDYYAHMKKKNQVEKSQKFTINPEKSKCSSVAMSYICKLKPKLGALNLELCVEQGVPPGPLLGSLKNGEDVVLPNGKLVKSTDVKDPDCPGPVFIVVDCPSLSYLDNLLNEEKFKDYQTGASEKNVAKHVIHFTPSHVMSDERYASWMKRFPETTNHVNVNDSNSCMGNIGVHILQRQMNYLDPEIFPLLNDQSIPIVDIPLNKKVSSDPDDILNKSQRLTNSNNLAQSTSSDALIVEKLNIPPHVGHTLKMIDLRDGKKKENQFPTCVYMNPSSVIEDLYLMQGFETKYKLLKSKLSEVSDEIKSENEKNPFPIITFLGTGSSIPNKSRNTSGILITFDDNSHMIMDCGEGTYGQIVRFFGADRADEILASTKAIYISHLHADHHIGSIQVLKKRREAVEKCNATCKKVYFLAPQQILYWFYNYHFYFEPILDCFELISNQDLASGKKLPEIDSMLEALNVKEIKTTKVRHCPHSFGVSVIDSNDKKITYSGDTMPADSLVELGINSDLLIHEGTFEDELSHEAKMKMHSTTCEAIQVGKRMNAKFTILTHFSQRYYKIPVINEHFDDKVGIAFDNMRVRLGDLRKLPLFNSILKTVFSEENELLETRSVKRKRKLQLA